MQLYILATAMCQHPGCPRTEQLKLELAPTFPFFQQPFLSPRYNELPEGWVQAFDWKLFCPDHAQPYTQEEGGTTVDSAES